jgi:hypothetical protein
MPHKTNSLDADEPKDQRQLSTFAPGSYDVIVDTFGLCSHEHPVKVSLLLDHLISC